MIHAAIGSMISLGYYLRVVAVTWTGGPVESAARFGIPRSAQIVAVTSAVAIVLLALAGGPIMDMCGDAAQGLVGSIEGR